MSTERYLVQFLGSSRFDHVGHGVGVNVVFGLDRHGVDCDRGHSGHLWRGVRCSLCLGVGMSRQDILDGSGKCPVASHPLRTTAIAQRLAQHVRTVPDIQTSTLASLSNLQSVYLTNGPSLPVDEQLRGCGQSQTLFALLDVHMDLCGILPGLVWMELLLLR